MHCFKQQWSAAHNAACSLLQLVVIPPHFALDTLGILRLPADQEEPCQYLQSTVNGPDSWVMLSTW